VTIHFLDGIGPFLEARVGDLARFCVEAIERALAERKIELPEPEDPRKAPFYRERQDLIRRLLATKGERLTDQEKKILRLRAGLEDGRFHSLKEVAKRLGCVHGNVAYHEKRALRKLGLEPTEKTQEGLKADRSGRDLPELGP